MKLFKFIFNLIEDIKITRQAKKTCPYYPRKK